MTTLKELQSELARELAMRNKKYPEWIQSGLLTQATAEKQFNRLKTVALLLGAMTEREFQDLRTRATSTEPKKKEQLDLFSV